MEITVENTKLMQNSANGIQKMHLLKFLGQHAKVKYQRKVRAKVHLYDKAISAVQMYGSTENVLQNSSWS